MKAKGIGTIQERLLDEKAIDRAMRKAVKVALLRHKRAGLSVVVWRFGEVVRVKPTQIKVSQQGSRRVRPGRSSSLKSKSRE